MFQRIYKDIQLRLGNLFTRFGQSSQRAERKKIWTTCFVSFFLCSTLVHLSINDIDKFHWEIYQWVSRWLWWQLSADRGLPMSQTNDFFRQSSQKFADWGSRDRKMLRERRLSLILSYRYVASFWMKNRRKRAFCSQFGCDETMNSSRCASLDHSRPFIVVF